MTAVPIITDNHGITITFSSNNIFEADYTNTLTLAPNNVVYATTPGVFPASTISNIIILGGKTKLSELTDVRTAGQADGDTIIFREANNTYNVETFNLDSGEF
jgi:hypothetical protein